MAQQFDYPKTEIELQVLLDKMYSYTRQIIETKSTPKIKGLYEIITSESVILTAIHNIKANKGSQTAGTDGKTIRPDILEQKQSQIITQVSGILRDYRPKPIKRVYIPKPGKTEKRPLGIPAISDRIAQECIRIVLEPILEAQFFAHSYGFRPMRDTRQALERVAFIAHYTNYNWVVEGDIKSFFDTVNHTILLKKLWHMGIRDRRVLVIIKKMLKAGILNEITVNSLGTPQGGILSPLLANVYLDSFDQWVTREWENKCTRRKYVNFSSKTSAMRKRSNLKPAYLIRYCDDWVILTDNRRNADKLKYRIAQYLKIRLKIELSDEKTKITNIRKKSITFLGIDLKRVRGKSRTKLITKTQPNQARLEAKIKKLHQKIKETRHLPNKEAAFRQINDINATIRGIIQYYQVATFVYATLKKYARNISVAAFKALKCYGVIWVQANQTGNLSTLHQKYKRTIPAILFRTSMIGVTDFRFNKWQKAKLKNEKETPYTAEGRSLYQERTQKRLRKPRDDDILTVHTERVKSRQQDDLYNLEYFLNRAYALNRDRFRCRVCSKTVYKENVHFHHITTNLPIAKINRVPNLATVHWECHAKVHDTIDYSCLGQKAWKKILRLREKLHKQ